MESDIQIKKANRENISDVNQCDGTFMIDSRLALSMDEDGELKYRILALPQRIKSYAIDHVDFETYVDNEEKAIFFAYVNGQIAGQIIIRTNWNRTAYIEDIVVDAAYRKIGVGKKLMQEAKKWMREKKLHGIMLETQSNNVPACKFYESNGFRIGGCDALLYAGLDKVKDEVALYWYYLDDSFA